MMRSRCLRLRCVVYFSRWNRKGYAIFASLGKQVKIASLAIGICEKALEKSSLKGVIVNFARTSQEAFSLFGETNKARGKQEGNVVMEFSPVGEDYPAGMLNQRFNIRV